MLLTVIVALLLDLRRRSGNSKSRGRIDKTVRKSIGGQSGVDQSLLLLLLRLRILFLLIARIRIGLLSFGGAMAEGRRRLRKPLAAHPGEQSQVDSGGTARIKRWGKSARQSD